MQAVAAELSGYAEEFFLARNELVDSGFCAIFAG
jgi:hypothetical protein